MRIGLFSFLLVLTVALQGMQENQKIIRGDSKDIQTQAPKPCTYCTQIASLSEKQKEIEENLREGRQHIAKTVTWVKQRKKLFNVPYPFSQEEREYILTLLDEELQQEQILQEKHTQALLLNREGTLARPVLESLAMDMLVHANLNLNNDKKIDAIVEKHRPSCMKNNN
jgi:hypothetical protein